MQNVSPSMLARVKNTKEINEKMNMDRKNLGKIVLSTTLAFSGLNLVNMTEVFNPT